ncbi:TIGR02611 family protein [Micromonospora sp. CPCC 206061]|uniref:TIGR02611 family protein n=1 Tax=Micromonospora sp. CPCC 206061 TaxID=3122410 RepID=UPI003FA5E1A0
MGAVSASSPDDGGPVAAPSSVSAPNGQPPERPRWRERVRLTLEVIRANPTGRIALKVFVAIAGLLVVALGAALIPLPGPGWLIVLGGIGIWAIEYSWARKLLQFTRRNLRKWTSWITRQSWPVRLLIGLVGMIFVGAVVWLTVRFSLGIDLVTSFLNYIATH